MFSVSAVAVVEVVVHLPAEFGLVVVVLVVVALVVVALEAVFLESVLL